MVAQDDPCARPNQRLRQYPGDQLFTETASIYRLSFAVEAKADLKSSIVQGITSRDPKGELSCLDPELSHTRKRHERSELPCKHVMISGEPCRIRTCDPLIKSQLLYQLS